MNNIRKMIPNGDPKILSEGRLGTIVGFPMLVDSGNGHQEKCSKGLCAHPALVSLH